MLIFLASTVLSNLFWLFFFCFVDGKEQKRCSIVYATCVSYSGRQRARFLTIRISKRYIKLLHYRLRSRLFFLPALLSVEKKNDVIGVRRISLKTLYVYTHTYVRLYISTYAGAISKTARTCRRGIGRFYRRFSIIAGDDALFPQPSVRGTQIMCFPPPFSSPHLTNRAIVWGVLFLFVLLSV